MRLRTLAIVLALTGLAACGSTDLDQNDITVPTSIPAAVSVPATVDVEQVASTFETWVARLAAGDYQAVWAGMAPASQQAVGEEDFFDSVVFEMSEGWGAWAEATDVTYDVVERDGETHLVVTGTVSQEGTTETREVSIPVVPTDDGWLMSPLEDLAG